MSCSSHINHNVYLILSREGINDKTKENGNWWYVFLYTGIYIYAISSLLIISKTVLVWASVLSLLSSKASLFSFFGWVVGTVAEWVPQVCRSTPGWGRGEAHMWRIFGNKIDLFQFTVVFYFVNHHNFCQILIINF